MTNFIMRFRQPSGTIKRLLIQAETQEAAESVAKERVSEEQLIDVVTVEADSSFQNEILGIAMSDDDKAANATQSTETEA